MFNTIVALGYLVKDPEIKQTQSGKSICMMRVCVSENNAKTKCFIDCEAWDKTAEACGKFLKKGREVLIEGELCMSSWTNKEGVTQSRHFIRANKVKFLNTAQKKDDGSGPAESEATYRENKKANVKVSNDTSDNTEDIPF
jgi:single-strand DNA-binding protein